MMPPRVRVFFHSNVSNCCGAPRAIDAFLCKKNLLKSSQNAVRMGVVCMYVCMYACMYVGGGRWVMDELG